MSERVSVAIFVNGVFDNIQSFVSPQEARGFKFGVLCGAWLFEGWCSAYILPDDDAVMREEESASEVAVADQWRRDGMQRDQRALRLAAEHYRASNSEMSMNASVVPTPAANAVTGETGGSGGT